VKHSRTVWITILVTVVAGTVSAGVAFVWTAHHGTGSTATLLPLALLFALYWAFPVLVLRDNETEGIHVDEAFLVMSLLLLPDAAVILVFATVPFVVQIVQRVALPKVLFNTGQIALSATAAVAVASLAGHHDPSTIGLGGVLAVVLGVAAFFVVNTAMIALIMSVSDSASFLRATTDGLGFNSLVFAATTSLGLLAALAASAFSWALIVAMIPLAVLQVVFARSIATRRERERIDGLLKAALDAHASVHRSDVERSLAATAAELLACRDARIESSPPGDDELGVRLPGDDGRWLVAFDKRGVEKFGVADRRLLDALATIGAGALDNASLVDQIHHQAFHDSLTGLPNRLLFEERLGYAAEQARRNAEPLAVMFVDLDRFKKVNDSLGHGAGNELLCDVAGRLRQCVRDGDTVARNGGDEFTILLPGLRSVTDAVGIAENLLAAFENPFDLDNHQLFVSPSIGIATMPEDGNDPAILLKHADMAMYRAKARGRNTYAFHVDGQSSSAYNHLTLEASLHQAIDREELSVLYQPQVDMATGRIVGVEALVRWPHPTLGMVSPAQFIPLAEETGLIRPIDRWVLHTACSQARAWIDAGLPPIGVAVNLSGHDFQHPRLVESVAEALASSGLEPRHLELEVTESVAIDYGDADDVFNRLKELGCHLAIDDFGTGYSILSRLQRLPLDKLKIDKSFIDVIGSINDDAPIVEALIQMAHGLGLQVTAEGVEKPEQWDWLESHHCDLVQGYFFSRPVPADDIGAMVRQRMLTQAATSGG